MSVFASPIVIAVSSVANAGTGGGWIGYVQYADGYKNMWGITSTCVSLASTGSGFLGVTFPISFTGQPAMSANTYNNVGSGGLVVYMTGITITTATLGIVNDTGVNGAYGQVSWLTNGF